MPLWILVVFYLTIAACEIVFPQKCLGLFEKLIGEARRIRILSAVMFFIALLYHVARPERLQWLILVLFWVYLLSGVWFFARPQSFASLCNKSYAVLQPNEKRAMLYTDCAIRTILALLLIYSI